MSVITISRETGSGGHFIAEKLAETLGYDLVDRHTIGRIFSKYGEGDLSMDIGYVPDFWNSFDMHPGDERRSLMVDTLNQVILALAHQDNMIIVGRSGFAVLGGFADVLNVRIQAPLALRVKHVMQRRQITDPDLAARIVRESDKSRAAFIEGFYGRRWDRADSFDIVIDTSKIDQPLIINWLIQAMKGLSAQAQSDSPIVKEIQVVPALAALVTEELHRTGAQKLWQHHIS